MSGIAALSLLSASALAGMKNSLVAPALIAIFVRGILAKFSHLQQDRGRTTLFDVYKPFLSSAVFHREKTCLSPSAASSIGDTEAGMDFSPPSLAWNDFIKFALIILLVSYWPRRRRCCLGTERDTRRCSFYRAEIHGNDIELNTISYQANRTMLCYVYVLYKRTTYLN